MGAGTSTGGMPQQPQSFGGQSNPYAQSAAKNFSQQPQQTNPSYSNPYQQMQPSQTANPFVQGQQTPQPYPNPYAPQQPQQQSQQQSRQLPEWLSQLFDNYGQQQSQQQQYSNPYAQQSPQQQQQYSSPTYYNPYQPQAQSQQAPAQEQPNAFTPNYPTDDYSQPQPQTQSGLGALQQYYGFAIDPYMPPPPPPPPPPTPVAPTPFAPTPVASAPQEEQGGDDGPDRYQQYLQNNPDVAKEYAGTVSAYGDYNNDGTMDVRDIVEGHFGQYGQEEGRTSYRRGGLAALRYG